MAVSQIAELLGGWSPSFLSPNEPPHAICTFGSRAVRVSRREPRRVRDLPAPLPTSGSVERAEPIRSQFVLRDEAGRSTRKETLAVVLCITARCEDDRWGAGEERELVGELEPGPVGEPDIEQEHIR